MMDKRKKEKAKEVKFEHIEEVSFEDFEKTMIEIVKARNPKRISKNIKKRG